MRILSLIGIMLCAALSVSLHAAEPSKKAKSKTAKTNSVQGPTLGHEGIKQLSSAVDTTDAKVVLLRFNDASRKVHLYP
jgi:hypothetical protein